MDNTYKTDYALMTYRNRWAKMTLKELYKEKDILIGKMSDHNIAGTDTHTNLKVVLEALNTLIEAKVLVKRQNIV